MSNDKRFIDGSCFNIYKEFQEILGNENEIHLFNEEIIIDSHEFPLEKGLIETYLPKKIESKTFINKLSRMVHSLREAEYEELVNVKKGVVDKYKKLIEPLEKAIKLRECFVFIESQGFKAVKQDS
jgi:hypothetical protein